MKCTSEVNECAREGENSHPGPFSRRKWATIKEKYFRKKMMKRSGQDISLPILHCRGLTMRNDDEECTTKHQLQHGGRTPWRRPVLILKVVPSTVCGATTHRPMFTREEESSNPPRFWASISLGQSLHCHTPLPTRRGGTSTPHPPLVSFVSVDKVWFGVGCARVLHEWHRYPPWRGTLRGCPFAHAPRAFAVAPTHSQSQRLTMVSAPTHSLSADRCHHR